MQPCLLLALCSFQGSDQRKRERERETALVHLDPFSTWEITAVLHFLLFDNSFCHIACTLFCTITYVSTFARLTWIAGETRARGGSVGGRVDWSAAYARFSTPACNKDFTPNIKQSFQPLILSVSYPQFLKVCTPKFSFF